MQCKSCGTALPMGISHCPTCGAPTPYARNTTAREGNTMHSDSTVASASPFGAEKQPPLHNFYTYNMGTRDISASEPGTGTGQEASGQSPQNPYTQNMYGEASTPATPNQIPYGEPAPVNPYEQPGNNYNNLYLGGTSTSNPYENTVQAPPPPPGVRVQPQEQYQPQPFTKLPQQQSYQPQPQFQPQAVFPAPQPIRQTLPPQAAFPIPQPIRQAPSGPAPLQRRARSSNGWKIALFVLILLLVGGGIIYAMKNQGGLAGNGTTSVNAPSGSQVVQSASDIITRARTVSSQKQFAPEKTTFKVNQPIYGMFDPKLSGQSGYVMGKWYSDSNLIFTTEIQKLNPTFQYQYFSGAYSTPTAAGSVEFYYCTKADCSDAQLAAVRHFKVTADGIGSDNQNNGNDNQNQKSYSNPVTFHRNKH